MKKVGSKVEEALPKSVTGPLRRTYDTLKNKGPKFVRSLASEIGQVLKDSAKSAVNSKILMYIKEFINDTFGEDIEKAKEKAKEIWMDIQEYLMSLDPVSVHGTVAHLSCNP